MRVSQIQEQIGRGEYQVDTLAVADAIVRRLRSGPTVSAGEPDSLQGECS